MNGLREIWNDFPNKTSKHQPCHSEDETSANTSINDVSKVDLDFPYPISNQLITQKISLSEIVPTKKLMNIRKNEMAKEIVDKKKGINILLLSEMIINSIEKFSHSK